MHPLEFFNQAQKVGEKIKVLLLQNIVFYFCCTSG